MLVEIHANNIGYVYIYICYIYALYIYICYILMGSMSPYIAAPLGSVMGMMFSRDKRSAHVGQDFLSQAFQGVQNTQGSVASHTSWPLV